MKDDPKIVTLPTGYAPEQSPPDATDVEELQWSISVLADEVKQLSVLLNKQVRAMAVFNNKLNEILKHNRK